MTREDKVRDRRVLSLAASRSPIRPSSPLGGGNARHSAKCSRAPGTTPRHLMLLVLPRDQPMTDTGELLGIGASNLPLYPVCNHATSACWRSARRLSGLWWPHRHLLWWPHRCRRRERSAVHSVSDDARPSAGKRMPGASGAAAESPSEGTSPRPSPSAHLARIHRQPRPSALDRGTVPVRLSALEGCPDARSAPSCAPSCGRRGPGCRALGDRQRSADLMARKARLPRSSLIAGFHKLTYTKDFP
jgi:hypothetical protein